MRHFSKNTPSLLAENASGQHRFARSGVGAASIVRPFSRSLPAMMLAIVVLSLLVLMASASASSAQCRNVGTRVKCLITSPSARGQNAGKSRLSARFVAVPHLPSGQPRQAQRVSRQVSKPRPLIAPVAAHERDDVLPDTYLILMNPTRYGLPVPRDGWTYFHVGSEIYRATLTSRKVLDYVTPHLADF